MIMILSRETGRKILIKLPETLRYKFAHPRVPHAVHDFFGTEELDLVCRAIMEIAYVEDLIASGQPQFPLGFRDGNWDEFTSWTGLSDEDMKTIKIEMGLLGWKPGMDRF